MDKEEKVTDRQVIQYCKSKIKKLTDRIKRYNDLMKIFESGVFSKPRKKGYKQEKPLKINGDLDSVLKILVQSPKNKSKS